MKIGITGGIGSGKSTITEYLLKQGYDVIDCDKIAHEITGPGSPTLGELAEALGSEILDDKGVYQRDKVADMVFSDGKKMEILNEITHRAILAEVNRRVEAFEGIHFVDAPLLFETNLYKEMDINWAVISDEEIRIKRVAARDNMPAEKVIARIKAQTSDEERKRLADDVLDNSGTPEELYRQIDILLKKYAG